MSVLCGPGERDADGYNDGRAVRGAEPWLYSGALGGHCTTLGDSWPLLATRNRGANPIRSPVLQPVRCTVSARLQTAKILKVGSRSIEIPTITLTMTQSTWHTYTWWLSILSR